MLEVMAGEDRGTDEHPADEDVPVKI